MHGFIVWIFSWASIFYSICAWHSILAFLCCRYPANMIGICLVALVLCLWQGKSSYSTGRFIEASITARILWLESSLFCFASTSEWLGFKWIWVYNLTWNSQCCYYFSMWILTLPHGFFLKDSFIRCMSIICTKCDMEYLLYYCGIILLFWH